MANQNPYMTPSLLGRLSSAYERNGLLGVIDTAINGEPEAIQQQRAMQQQLASLGLQGELMNAQKQVTEQQQAQTEGRRLASLLGGYDPSSGIEWTQGRRQYDPQTGQVRSALEMAGYDPGLESQLSVLPRNKQAEILGGIASSRAQLPIDIQKTLAGQGMAYDPTSGGASPIPGYQGNLSGNEFARSAGQSAGSLPSELQKIQAQGAQSRQTALYGEQARAAYDLVPGQVDPMTGAPINVTRGQVVEGTRAAPTNPLTGTTQNATIKLLEQGRDAASAAAMGLQSVNTARQLLNSGAIVGTGADFRKGLANALATAGLTDGNDVANTDAFVAAMASQVAAQIKAFNGGQGVSNADREFAEKAAGGNINLSEQSLRRILDIADKTYNGSLQAYNRRLDSFIRTPGINPGFEEAFRVTMPNLSAPTGAPQIGTVQEGYRYKGGNPADPSSWERAQ